MEGSVFHGISSALSSFIIYSSLPYFEASHNHWLSTIGCSFFNFINKTVDWQENVYEMYMWRLTPIPMIDFRYINAGMKRICWISMPRNDSSPLPDNGNSQEGFFAALTHDRLSKCPTLLRSVSVAWFILDWWCHVETKHFAKPSWDMMYCSKTKAVAYLYYSLTKRKSLYWFYLARQHTHPSICRRNRTFMNWFNMLDTYEL